MSNGFADMEADKQYELGFICIEIYQNLRDKSTDIFYI